MNHIVHPKMSSRRVNPWVRKCWVGSGKGWIWFFTFLYQTWHQRRGSSTVVIVCIAVLQWFWNFIFWL